MSKKKITVELDEHIYDYLKAEADDIDSGVEAHISSILYQRNIESRLFAAQLDDMIKRESSSILDNARKEKSSVIT